MPAPSRLGPSLGAVALVLLLLAGGRPGPAHPARAQQAEPAPLKLAIRPADSQSPYIDVTVTAGKRLTLTVELINGGKDRVAAHTYAADAYSLINGGLGVALADEPVSGATTWLTYPAEDLTLAPGEVVRRPVTLRVPKGTPPGDYLSTIVIQNRDVVTGTGAVAVNQVLRQAIAVSIDVPGPRSPGLTIGEPTYLPSAAGGSLRVAVANTGNANLTPAGELVLTDEEGRRLVKTPVEMGSVYAGTTTAVEVALRAPLAPGTYTLSLRLADPATGASAAADQVALAVAAPRDVAPAAGPSIEAVTITPVHPTPDGPVQYADVAVTLANPGAPLTNARLTLRVSRDGELVEEYVVADSLAVPTGTAQVAQRYLPATGWLPGRYTFSVTLATVTADGGGQELLAMADAPAIVIAD